MAIEVIIGGDYVPQENIAKMMEEGDFSYFDEIKSIFQKGDFSIINLEAPIVERVAKPIKKCGPNLKTTPKVIESLHYLGVDMVTLANNHIMDYGPEGLNDTISHLDEAHILHVGTGKNINEAQKIKYVEIGDKTLAIINCCEHEFSIATEIEPGANPLNPIQQYYAIRDAKQNADYVLVIVHGGHEHWQLPSPRMVETYRFFVDAGADAVVNHHQHCYSGYEIYNGKPIFYGLGNLCFEYITRKNIKWNFGYLVRIDLDKQISFKIIPYSQCNGMSNIKLLNGHSFDNTIAELNKSIEDRKILKMESDNYYESCSKQIKGFFEPYRGRVLNKLYSWGILPSFIKGSKRLKIQNLINCESHKDKVSYCLQNIR